MFKQLICIAALALSFTAMAQQQPTVVDLPTRPGVTQRMLVITPPEPKAAVILLAGGHGGLQIFQNGAFKWGEGNFLVRSRQLFADKGLMAVVVDAPSDRQRPPFLNGFRQTEEHAADLKATIAWAKATAKVPVWLVGTSRGTQSAAYAATVLQGADAPDGVVLTATILTDDKQRPVTAMALEKIQVPVLVVHHQQDGCAHCAYTEVPGLMGKLTHARRSQLITTTGGKNQGDACAAFAHHGFNGLEADVVGQIADWILAPAR
ncbi:alpha/beta hydrolase [Acidovorax radicis]|uniref:alpha/beta hydrolase n=1 Tax=Acidovorax radicis TaxID=758826 RepID=UPI001CF8261B|nr:alpha/beta hydrolase [Acidovorax radicis]UCU98695.1 alpha/beta hydrolase [Acidovorax radicis]